MTSPSGTRMLRAVSSVSVSRPRDSASHAPDPSFRGADQCARRHPANALLVAVPAYYAYANWHHPRWDKRIVSAVAVGLGAIFSAEGALGWFEYKQEHPRA